MSSDTSGLIASQGSTGGTKIRTIYVLGRLGYDFLTEANRDAFVQSGVDNPDEPSQLLAYLEQAPWAAEDVTWTVLQEGAALYAVRPVGAYASQGFALLRRILQMQSSGSVEIVSFPGNAGCSVTLRDGQEVPWLHPNLRGIFAWTSGALVEAVVPEPDDTVRAHVLNFLRRVYYEFRNKGVTARERALNYAATNAFQAARVFENALSLGLVLQEVDARPSPLNRVESDCWDVEMKFFDPKQRLTRAAHVYRLTVDVRTEIPVTIGTVRHWDVF
jgi:cyanobactin maturation PatA/PatG family protease